MNFSRPTGYLLLLLAAVCAADDSAPPAADTATYTLRNPILKGGFPDPSICRDDDGYYLVNSSFEYFPGLPVHRSEDLVNWTLVGHGLHRAEQATGEVNLVDVQSNGGIHAPSIRCHNGRYYIISTNVYLPPGEGAETQFVNFIVTADDPSGPWSMPIVIDDAPGIDPDLFFDDDGRAWYVGTHSPEEPNFEGEGEIWLQELDTATWQLKGDRHFLWRGACGGVWAEGPHLYKYDGRYYLLIAEGGTSFNHAVMVASSKTVTGPYQANPRNPILTSRHLSYDHWVNSIGHADLIELADGRWYAVTLGIRGDESRRSNMGRETHLVPVSWEREPFWWQEENILWPVMAPDTGRVERVIDAPFAGVQQDRRLSFVDEFDSDRLALDWNFRRVPAPGSYGFADGRLRLAAKPAVIAERQRASLLGSRQTESDFDYEAKMRFDTDDNEVEAGLNLFQKDDNFLSLTVRHAESGYVLRAVLSEVADNPAESPGSSVIGERKLNDYNGEIQLRVMSFDDHYRLRYSTNAGLTYEDFATIPSDRLLSRGYTGAYLGLYATSNGMDSEAYAEFDWVRYEAFERP